MLSELDMLLLVRYAYAQGYSAISDAEYDSLKLKLESQGINLNPIYEDDPFPEEAWQHLQHNSNGNATTLLCLYQEHPEWHSATTKEQPTSLFSSPDFDLLTESDSLSISAVTEYRDAYAWFESKSELELVISTKIDGINTRRGYKYNEGKLHYNASLTRGRKSDPFDITSNMRLISPSDITTDIHHDLVVYSETIVPTTAISYINEKYVDDYTIPRNLAMAMMRVDKFEPADFEYLKSFVFRLDWGETLSDGIDKARELGFDTVPYILYTYHHMSYEDFVQDIERIIKELKDQTDAMNIITDGMVAEINNRSLAGQAAISNNYSSANIALKIGLWQPGVYESRVIALDLSQQSEQCTCVAIVEPVIAKGGQRISRVNCFNPSILFANDIRPGKTIRFEYKNETTVNLIVN